MLKKALAEFIGTFFLCITVTMVLYGEAGEHGQLAVSAMLAACIYALGYISRAHFNPATTLAMYLRKKCTLPEVPYYLGAQLAASVAAPLVAAILLSPKGSIAAPININIVPALIAEFIGTFILILVILKVATAPVLEGNSFYGTAIGMVVLGIGGAFGKISGGAFNPAVALTFCVAEVSEWQNIWVYLVGSFGGATLAVVVFNYLTDKEN